MHSRIAVLSGLVVLASCRPSALERSQVIAVAVTVAPQFVQVRAATPQSPVQAVTATFATAQIAGDTNVIVVGWNDTTSSVLSVSDVAGNTYARAIGPTRGVGVSQSIYYASNIVSAAAGANAVTVRFDAPAQYVDLRILEYSGIDAATPADGAGAATGSGLNAQATATATAGDLLFAANTVATWNVRAGTGYTARIITTPDSDLAEDAIAATTGSTTASAPLGWSGSWVMQLVAFRPASAAPAPAPVVAISVSPATATVATGGTVQLAASVSGAADASVKWSILEGAAGGAVSASGLYTAPSTAGTFHVVATSNADPTKSASATVTVTAPATAVIRFVQVSAATPQSPTSTVKVTYPRAQAAGDTNVVVIGWADVTATVLSVTDAAGNKYASALPPIVANGFSQAIFYATNVAAANAGTNAVTVAFSLAAVFPDVRILEYAGIDATVPIDTATSATGTSTTSSSGVATVSTPGALLLGANTISSITTGPGTGYTSRIITTPDGNIAEDEIASAAGSYGATAAITFGNWVMQLVAFRPAGAAPLPVPPPPTVSVSVSPATATVAPGASLQFTATVTGALDTSVSWAVREGAAGGTISTTGLYTAPASAGAYHVQATSAADPTRSALATVSVPAASSGATYALAADRTTQWKPGVTYNGGIPVRTTICQSLSPRGPGLDDTAAIQAALDACPDSEVVQLSTGDFHLSGQGIRIGKSNIVLRGSGPTTRLIKTPGTAYAAITVSANPPGAPPALGQPTPLVQDALKGARTVTLVSNPGITAGELVAIDQLTDPNLTSWNLTRSPPGDPSRGWFSEYDRPVGQIVEVQSVSGNVLTLTTPLHIAFVVASKAQVSRYLQWGGGPPWAPLAPFVKSSGIEDLYVSGGGGGDSGGNIHLNNAAYSWVKNVEADFQAGTSVNVDASFRCELRDSYVHSAQQSVPGGVAYGIGINAYASDNLVENNISWNHNKVMVMRASGGGNVIGYNYFEDGWITYAPNFVEVGANASHMTTPHYELFEGNEAFNFDGDMTWGGSIYITAFRNHLTTVRRSIPPVGPYQDLGNRRGIGIELGHWWYSFVANVIGYAGFTPTPGFTTFTYERLTGQSFDAARIWDIGYDAEQNWTDFTSDAKSVSTTLRDGNFDFYTGLVHWHGIGGTGVGQTTPPANSVLPSSLYLPGKPAFFGASPWPWVDPAGATKLFTLPARARFDAMPH